MKKHEKNKIKGNFTKPLTYNLPKTFFERQRRLKEQFQTV